MEGITLAELITLWHVANEYINHKNYQGYCRMCPIPQVGRGNANLYFTFYLDGAADKSSCGWEAHTALESNNIIYPDYVRQIFEKIDQWYLGNDGNLVVYPE
ncbi:MAG: hypothetical protein COC01_03545 [Bacteroidetes bacterium]|nr:hypothetical protein [Bacteroidia bacterium]MBN4052348.1 hypothetical protein [Sphingobacteriaceae bacterium AH-315-L07]PCH68577.1 MAG: hypothetical protein COC01_03545 [Bacteroidota bacterium]